MQFAGFIGPTYMGRSVVADCQKCTNLMAERNESGTGKSEWTFYRTPGLAIFATLPDFPVRRLYEQNGRVFAVAGSTFFEISSLGVATVRGTVDSTGNCSIAGSITQLMIAAGTHLYCFTLATNVFTPVLSPLAEWVTASDSYFIAMEPNTQTIYVSGILNGLTWDPADMANAEAKPDNLIQIVADHREVWMFGTTSIQPYYDSGNADFPFDPIPGATIEMGSIGKTVERLDNTMFWVNQDERGNGMVWRAEGYRPVRISTHAIEISLQALPDLSSAESWSYQEGGHSFYCLCIPGSDSMWVYDVATSLWHERSWWNAPLALYKRHRAHCHCFGFSKHLVGDWENGKVYAQSSSYYTDAGDTIRWMRRAPHLANETKRIFYHRLTLDMECGVGLPDGTDPQVMMRYSNDGGRNWSNESWATSYGTIGQTSRRVMWNRLGAGRDRVFEVAGTDPVPVSIIDAFLELTAGTN